MISVLRMTLRCKKPPKSQCTVQCIFIQLLTKHQFTSIDHKHDKRYCITLYIHVHGCKNTMGIVAHSISLKKHEKSNISNANLNYDISLQYNCFKINA